MYKSEKLQETIEVIELKDSKKVNKYLNLGWTLISTHLWDYGHPKESQQKTVYCLSWSKKLGDPKHVDGIYDNDITD